MIDEDFSFDVRGWPPENQPFAVSSLDLRVEDGDHPLQLAHQDEILENWKREKAAKPAFFDGRMVLHRRLALREGAISGVAHLVSFSTFLWWRRQGESTGACHLFGMAVPISSDGAIIAIRMGPHTANAGMIYCAAGSLDEHDICGGRCDVDRNMHREVREETGLDLTSARADPTLYASWQGRRVHVFRFYHFNLTADAMLERIGEHMKTDPEQEIDGAIALRSGDPKAHHYNRAMAPILSLYFG